MRFKHFRPFSTGAMLTSQTAVNAAMGNSANAALIVSAQLNGLPGQTVFGPDLDLLDQPGVDNAAMSEYWRLVHDIVEGTKAIRDRHAVYLPRFPHENEQDYKFRWKNSKFTNVYRDVLENLVSKPFEQEVTLVEDETKPIPNAISDFIEDVDGTGNHLTVFAADTFFNGVNAALDWIFVDYSQAMPAPDGRTVRTVADERALGVRPFWTHVIASNVLDVRSKVIAGKERFTYFRIVEHEAGEKYIRIMRADENLAAWELYKEVPKARPGEHKFEFIGTGPITINEIPMVPFITGRRKGRSWQFHPAMKDAAELQIELYQSESGLKNIKNLGGFPILVGEGVKPPTKGAGRNAVPETLATGPQTVLYGGTDAQGKPGTWKFIVPPADIYRFLLEDIKETTNQLRELGRNPLTAQSGNMTVVTAATAAKKGNSAVQLWAFGLKDSLENALVLTGKWMNITKDQYDPQVNVFTDFEVEGQSEDVAHLISARKNREISRKTFWRELVRRGVLSGEFDPETEELLLLDDMLSPESDLTDDDPAGND